MSQILQCPHCGGGVQSSPELAGQLASCPHCSGQFVMGAAVPEPAPVAAASQPLVQQELLPPATTLPAPSLPAAQAPAARPRKRKARKSGSLAPLFIALGSLLGVGLIVGIVLLFVFTGGEQGDNDPFFAADVKIAKERFNQIYRKDMPEKITWKVEPRYVAVFLQRHGRGAISQRTIEANSRDEALKKAETRYAPRPAPPISSMHRIGTDVTARWEFTSKSGVERIATYRLRVEVVGYAVINGKFKRPNQKKTTKVGYRSTRKSGQP